MAGSGLREAGDRVTGQPPEHCVPATAPVRSLRRDASGSILCAPRCRCSPMPSNLVAPRRLAALALVLLCGFSAAAAAQVEVGAGVSFTRDNEDTPVAAVAWLPEWREFRGGTLRWELGAMHVRGRSDSAYDNGDDVTVFHGGLRYERPSGMVAGFGA